MSETSASIEAAALVAGLYRGFLGREPDPAGLEYWSGRVAAGASANELLAAITGSDEYRAAQAQRQDLAALQQRVLAAAGTLLKRPLTVVDIGAQELEGEKHVYAPLVDSGLPYQIIGFEPQQDKIDAAMARNPDSRVKLFPTFIGDGQGHTFHINNDDATSSLLPLNEALNSGLVDLSHLRTVRKVDVSTSRLDDVLSSVGAVDFLKLDIQGFEMPVLQHAAAVLQRTNVVHCEVSFMPIYDQQALFSEVETLLRDAGFYLLDFSSLCRYPSHSASGQMTRDRLGWGDAVFLREPSANADAQDLLAQSLAALLVYGKPSIAAALAERFDAACGERFAASFAKVAA